VSGRINITPVM